MLYDQFKRPLRDLRISVTDRCNFRCNYCMPADLFGHDYVFMTREQILSFEEICRLARSFVQLGVSKIRLTGGEPLLRSNLESLIEMLVRIEGVHDIALTTNGYLLAEKAKALRSAGLSRITVSLDTLNPDVLAHTAGKHLNIKRVLRGLEAAKEEGFAPIKINTVVQKGVNDGEVVDLVRFAKANGYIIRFIEFMDVGNLNNWRMDDVVASKEVVSAISGHLAIEPVDRDYRGEVATRYRFLDGEGEFGVISSVTAPFCGDCTRARLSADGRLFTCLFANQGVDLKTALREGISDHDLTEMIACVWQARTDRYSEQRTAHTQSLRTRKIEMYQIGG